MERWRTLQRVKNCLKISVDLSFDVKNNSRSSTMDLDLNTSAGKVIKSSLDTLPYYFAVSGCVESKGGFHLRCSQSCLKQALFLHFGPDSVPSVCLRVLKVLRDISFPTDIEENDRLWRFQESCADFESIQHSLRNVFSLTLVFFMFGLIDVSAFSEKDELFNKWISSYALKTLVLFEWEENPTEEQWAGSNLSDRFLNILNNLVLCLKKGRLRSFFYNDYNVSPKEDINNFKTHPVHTG